MAKKKYTDAQIRTALDLRERGLTCGQIALKTGMTESAVSWYCLRLGADTPQTRQNTQPAKVPEIVERGGHFVRRFSDADDARLLSMENAGQSIHAIARTLNRAPSSIRNRLSILARRQERRMALAAE